MSEANTTGYNSENPPVPADTGYDKEIDAAGQHALLHQWEISGQHEAQSLNTVTQAGSVLPRTLSLAAATSLFLATLKGQSSATARTYRTGCRRLMWFVYSTGRGVPDGLAITSLSPTVLEDFYLWLVGTYGRQARTTHSNYLAAGRNIFEFLASRELTPGGCQYQQMIARLGKLQGRASYRTPRIKGRQVEQLARLALPPDSYETITNEEPNIHNDPVDEHLPAKRKARSPEEIQRQKLEELRDRAIILTLFTSGMRRQEVANLNRADLESFLTENRPIQSRPVVAGPSSQKDETENEAGQVFEIIITGKGQKERVVYFDQVTMSAIGEYLALRGRDGYRPLFVQHHRGRQADQAGYHGEGYRVSLVTVWQVVVKYARRLGLEVKPHDFRHNLATTLLNAGAHLSEVQDILGHASPTTTKQIYAHYDKGHLREAFTRYRKSAAELS